MDNTPFAQARFIREYDIHPGITFCFLTTLAASFDNSVRKLMVSVFSPRALIECDENNVVALLYHEISPSSRLPITYISTVPAQRTHAIGNAGAQACPPVCPIFSYIYYCITHKELKMMPADGAG